LLHNKNLIDVLSLFSFVIFIKEGTLLLSPKYWSEADHQQSAAQQAPSGGHQMMFQNERKKKKKKDIHRGSSLEDKNEQKENPTHTFALFKQTAPFHVKC